MSENPDSIFSSRCRPSSARYTAAATLASALLLGACSASNVDATALDGEQDGTIEAALSGHGRDRVARLGELIFNDTSLSSPAGQGCATCHAAELAFTDPDMDVPTSQGVLADRFGVRNSPMAAYAAFVPPLHVDPEEGLYVGGLFLDGRVDTLEQQAGKPFLNPLEMNNADQAEVVAKLRRAPYRRLFEQVYGRRSLEQVELAYDRMTRAIAAFERTLAFQPFSSKYDAYLAGEARLSRQERWGLSLFEDPAKGNCAACHPSVIDEQGGAPQFTDFTYDNIGIPKNPDNPFYTLPPELNPEGAEFVDRGLGVTVGDAAEDGKFRVSSLRNVALTAPYGHNGYFADLRSVVQFYNTRDVAPWPAAEVPDTMNRDELGNLGLSAAEVDAIVAFLGTLTDGYRD
jgi:cytochrome c peroxidase